MPNFMTSTDIAAAALFMPSYQALSQTFDAAMSEVIAKYPRYISEDYAVEFSPDINAFMAWSYLDDRLNTAETGFWLGIGIWFPTPAGQDSDDPVGIPKHEPFLFVMIEDEEEEKSASELFDTIPDGWIQIYDDFDLIVTRPLSQFDPEPQARAQALIDWAVREVGRAIVCMPGFDRGLNDNAP